ncbi:hypothetical protein COT97_02705 [Candidatus Falkowbacteria bacterium CG10_big_fil_rev_8_21_14_0_10_39_11]|uniref:Response regulatory domain-containing protein n=1 Tax=Candidatus Falkowbacteria bacterium CG10_big_fil_rev_8_21_14_0_10_39_11 TaxID=1974565 RepID=A0A2H0V558_9BACT|nr:MAG: hypothetical protein COT97_02705 [Candidatus Falkowbacteria bacterium CG10_big_fil_rev_8_21_14_0_10_39_11]
MVVAKKLILLVVSDEAYLRSVQKIMDQLGFVIVSALTQIEAIDQFIANQAIIDLILLDACVPGKKINTIPLVTFFRRSGFDGLVVGISADRGYNLQLVESGASDWCYKNQVGSKVQELFQDY